MKIQINRRSHVPLSKQIYIAIADRILSGDFESGSRLPAVREMAKTLQVSPVTVMGAIQMLEKKRLITRIQGKGIFVNGERLDSGEQKESLTRERLLPDYLHRSQDSFYTQQAAKYNLIQSTICPDLLPKQMLAHNVLDLMKRQPEVLVEYGEIQGDLSLRSALSHYLMREQIDVSPNEILVTNGSQQGIDLVSRCFIGPGDIVVTEEPTYAGAIDVFRSRGATVLSVPMDENGMRMDQLTTLCDTYHPKFIYTIPTFHNPTGQSMSLRRRYELLELAESFNFLIVEDDPWSELYYDREPLPHLKALDTAGNVIYLKGFSKILSPGSRVGFLTAPEEYMQPLIVAKNNADLGNPLLNQRIILPLFETDAIRAIVKELRAALKMRRDLVLTLLKEHAPSDVRWNIPNGGVNFWLTLPEEANTLELLKEASRQGIQFLPGSACYPSDIQFNHLRLCFSYVKEEELRQGVRELLLTIKAFLSSATSWKGQKPHF